jgi:hypothetical protein
VFLYIVGYPLPKTMPSDKGIEKENIEYWYNCFDVKKIYTKWQNF